MSKIGNKIITIPEGVTISVEKGGAYAGLKVKVTGPKGELTQDIRPDINININGQEAVVARENENKRTKAYHGLYRSIIQNMVNGVTTGFEKKLEIVGVGYRGTQVGENIELAVGFSHKVLFKAPAGIKISMTDENNILISGADRQLVGQTASNIRSIRKPEPYKGKGIRYLGEHVRRKAGKTSIK